MPDKVKIGKKEKEKKIRGVFWGASRSDIQKSEKWRKHESHDKMYLCFLGQLYGHICNLNYRFDEDDKLIQIIYYFAMGDHVLDKKEFLFKNLVHVLVENYGERAGNYLNENIWVVHDDQTVIQLKIDERGVTVSMTHNTGRIKERRIDHYKQALREL